MSSKVSCAHSEFQLRIQGALADISSFISNTSDVENEQTKSESWDYTRYLERVHTYKSTTWFAKPSWMSPIVCSRYGWTNIDEDVLQCVGCQSVFVGRLPVSYDPVVYDSCRKRLETQISQLAHHPCCVWPGNPTPLSVIYVDGSNENGDTVILDTYIKRVIGLRKLGTELPVIDPSFVSLGEVDLNSLLELLEQNNISTVENAESQEVLTSAALLALCGWEASDNSSLSWPQVHCKTCNRCNGLWNFVTHSSSAKADYDIALNCASEYEDCLSVTNEDAVSANDCISPSIDVAANVAPVSTDLLMTEVLSAFVDGSPGCSQVPIIKCDDNSVLLKDITHSSSIKSCCDSVGSSSSWEAAAESKMLVSSETSEPMLEADVQCSNNTDLCFRHSLADVVTTEDKLVKTELSGDEFELEVVASLNTVVDHVCKNETKVVDDQASKQSVDLQSCEIPLMQSEACGIEDINDDLLLATTGDPVGEKTEFKIQSMPHNCDLDFEHSAEKLDKIGNEIDNNMPDALQIDSTSGVQRSSVDNTCDSTIDCRLEVNASFASSSINFESHVSANVIDVFHATPSNESGENRAELLLGEASSLSLVLDNGSQTQKVPFTHQVGDSETTRTENNSSTPVDSGSDPAVDPQSSLDDDAPNDADLLPNSGDSFEDSATSRKRSSSQTDSNELLPDRKKRRRVVVPVRRRTVFDAVAEHREWCPWVTSALADVQEGQTFKPWLRLLRSLLSYTVRKPASVDACTSPKALESIRHLFRSWASDAAS